MTKKQRVLTALRCGVPDCVPYMHPMIDGELQEAIVGHPLSRYRFDSSKEPGVIAVPGEAVQTTMNYCIHPETAEVLGLDALGIKFNYPLFVHAKRGQGGFALEGGRLTSWDEARKMRMPDPDQEDILREAADFIAAYSDRYAIFACIRLGISPLLMGIGYEAFAYMLYEDPELIRHVLEQYLEYNRRFIRNLIEIGFDLLWAFDDIAFGTGPLFSPAVWDEIFLEPVSNLTRTISIPWIYHSDGNLLPILDRMLPLGMSGIHPLEPGAMDLRQLKAGYGSRLCLVGNIDINTTLCTGDPAGVAPVVRERIDVLAPGGGYILSDSNCIPYFCRAENMRALGQAVEAYRHVYAD